MSISDFILPLADTRPLPSALYERRKQKRLACHPMTSCRITAEEAAQFWALRVQNLSLGGAKLMVSGAAPIDRVRTATFFNAGRGVSCERSIWKAYQFRTGDGLLVLGIAFAKELDQEELAMFI